MRYCDDAVIRSELHYVIKRCLTVCIEAYQAVGNIIHLVPGRCIGRSKTSTTDEQELLSNGVKKSHTSLVLHVCLSGVLIRLPAILQMLHHLRKAKVANTASSAPHPEIVADHNDVRYLWHLVLRGRRLRSLPSHRDNPSDVLAHTLDRCARNPLVVF